jgi:hypothetical protein
MQKTIFQQAVNKELKRRKWTKYHLAQELDGQIHINSIYNWLRGDCGMLEENIEIIFKKLRLDICLK